MCIYEVHINVTCTYSFNIENNEKFDDHDQRQHWTEIHPQPEIEGIYLPDPKFSDR